MPSDWRSSRSRIEPWRSRLYQGCRLLPTTMILIAYSRAKARIVLATSWPAERHRDAAELLGELEVLADQALGRRVDAGEVFGRELDVNGVPGGVEPVGDPGGLAQERRRVGAAAGDADHHAVGRRERDTGRPRRRRLRRSIRWAISVRAISRSRVRFDGVKKFSSAVLIRSAG